MKRIILFLVIIGLGLTAYYYRADIVELFTGATDKVSQEKVLRNFPLKEVEIFELGKEEIELEFTKSGVSASYIAAYVTPQISGEIIDITVKIGDRVDEGDTLITLGETLNTYLADLQYQSTQDSLKILRSTKQLTQQSTYNSLASAQISVKTAKEVYENAQKTKANTQNLFDEQVESTKLGIETAEKAYKNAKKNYNRALDALDDLEDQLDDLEDDLDDMEDELDPSDPTLLALNARIEQLEMAVDQAEATVDNAKFGKESAKLALEQAQIGLDQLIKGQYSQEDQLNFGIETAYLQYQSALSQLQNIETGGQLQELGIESQIVQLNSSAQTAALNVDQKNVKSPIDGVITSISAKEENLVSPGQALIKVENSKKLSIKTSVNEEEAKLISVGNEVIIEGSTEEAKGKIVSISPSLNEMSRKIDVEIEINTSTTLTPGSFVKIRFSPTPKDTIFIPLNSVSLDEGKKLVKTIDKQNTVQNVEIETGQIIGSYIEVLSGLKGNEKIINTVTVFLEEGEKVALAN